MGGVAVDHWKRPVLIALALSAALWAAAHHSPDGLPQPDSKEPTSTANQLSATPAELVVGGKVVGKPIRPEPGEICLVCNHPVDTDQLPYLVEGQRVAVHRGNCDSVLRSDARKWLARLKPHGAFLGAGPSRRREDPAAGNQVIKLGLLEPHCEPNNGLGEALRSPQKVR